WRERSWCDTSLPAKRARLAGRRRIENLHRDAEMKEQLVAGLRARNEGERHNRAVFEPAGAGAVVVPHLSESGERTDAHQPSTSTLSIRTPVAPGDSRSPSTTASTSAPSAGVARAASSKCSRKCSGVKCESAPSRTETRLTRAAPFSCATLTTFLST